MIDKYAEWVIRWRWWVILASVIFTMSVASGARFLEFTNDYRAFFSDKNPQLVAFEQLQTDYAKADNVMLVITPKDGRVFTPNTLDTLVWATQLAWKTPYSNRVESITNFQHTQAQEDDLEVADLIQAPLNLSVETLASKEKIAVAEPVLINRLINKAASVTGINITVQLPGKSLNEVPEVAQYAKTLAQQIRDKNPNLRVDITGIVMMNNTFSEESQGDMGTLVPLMFLVILVTLGLMLRRVGPVLITLLVIIFSIVFAMGAFGWSGLKMTAPLASAPTIILTMAVADAVHLFMNYMAGLRLGKTQHQAMADSIRLNFIPVFLTSITTVVGFLSMNFTDVPPLAHLGNTVAVGVAMAWLLSMTLLPALGVVLPIRAPKAQEQESHPIFDRIAEFVVRERKIIYMGFAIILLVALWALPRNQINDEFVKYFDTDVEFRQATDYAAQTLNGPYTLDVSIDSGEDNGIADPAFLKAVEGFVNYSKTLPEVRHVFTLTDVMKRLNQNMHGDQPEFYTLPEERELSAQYLLMYEMSLPYGLDLTNQITLEKSATKVTLSLENLSSTQLLSLESKIGQWFQQNHAALTVQQASTALIFAHIGQRNAKSQTLGLSISLLVISLILVVALRSVKLGLLSMIPNIIPAVLAFGVWGIIDGQVGMSVSVVAGVTLGIVVDDTIHFLSKYLYARREQGMTSENAIRYVYSQVGQALVVTTLVLCAGFSMLLFSNFKLNSDLGLLSCITIAIALALDLLLLPALLKSFDGEKNHV